MDDLPRIKVTRRTGKEPFHNDGTPLSIDLLSFWQWSASDLVNNTLRGVLAEYVVASAIGVAEGGRIEWDAYDLEMPEGTKVEVKSSAYIQSWSQKRLSTIQFDIRPTKGWDSKTNTYSTEVARQADVYVFCLLKHKNQDTIDPLNMDHWTFYVLSTKQLNRSVGDQKQIALSRLLRLNPLTVGYEGLGSSIAHAANN
jgi:hypothetical protein